MSGITTVRLTDAPVWPTHGSTEHSPELKPGKAAVPGAHRSREIAVFLPPVQPDDGWTCDTPMVWRVTPDSLDALGFHPVERVFVCIHQIQAD